MNQTNRRYLALTTSGILACLSAPAGAQIFSDGFNAAAGNQNGTQLTTTLAVQFGANYDNWTIAGSVGHQVDLNTANAGMISGNPESLPNPNQWAAMLLLNQVLTSNANIAANTNGQQYTVDFTAGPANYSAAQQSSTANGNGLRIDVVDNNGAGSVIGTTTFTNINFDTLASALNLGMSGSSFAYTGSGVGDVKLVITGLGGGVFQGSIDEISVDLASAPGAPEITSFTASPSTLADSGDAVTFDWAVTGDLPFDSLVITPGNIDVLGSTFGGTGTYLLDPGPDGTTEYTLTATKGGDMATANATVTLPPPTINSFTASPMPVVEGAPLTLSWDVDPPFNTIVLDPGNIDVSSFTTVAGTGTYAVTATQTTNYTLTASRGTSTSNAEAKAVVVSANAIFCEHFNGYTGTQSATQYETGLEVAHTGAVAGWSNAGSGTMHAVDLANLGGESNPSDWAILFFQNNVITQSSGVAANDSGSVYDVTFEYGTAVYAGDTQRTETGDGLLVEVLRGDNTVLASQSFLPGAWDDTGSQNLDGALFGTLAYTGDGSGDVRLRIGPDGPLTSGRFEGSIDNVCVNFVSAGAISIASFTASPSTLADSGDAVTFDWAVSGMPLDSLVITPGDIDVLGSTTVAGTGTYLLDPGPGGTTEYTLTATKGGDIVPKNVTVTLPPPTINSFTATPSPVNLGGDVTLSWDVDEPFNKLIITPGDIDVTSSTFGGTGSTVVSPGATTVYTLTASRGTSDSTADATAVVIDPNNLFSESFDGITGMTLNGGPAGQFITTHDLGVFGNLAGWSKAGAGTIHAVDTANTWNVTGVSTNTPNWGVMIWQDNVITQDAVIAGSNDNGVEYSIDFLGAGATYALDQRNNGTTDGLKIELLDAGGSVVNTFTQVVAQPVGVGDLGLTAYSFNYTGDGSGEIRFRIGPINAGAGRFQGTIDDLLLSVGGGGGGSAFDTWADSNGVTGGQGGDDDSGGLNNLGEFGLGGDPLNQNDDGSLLHAFSKEVVGGGPEEGILTIAVRNAAVGTFSTAAPSVSASVDGIVYTVSAESTLPVAGNLTVTPTAAVTAGLPPAPAGYTYVSFYISGPEGYFQVTVAPAP